jgi:hypothetical protein
METSQPLAIDGKQVARERLQVQSVLGAGEEKV